MVVALVVVCPSVQAAVAGPVVVVERLEELVRRQVVVLGAVSGSDSHHTLTREVIGQVGAMSVVRPVVVTVVAVMRPEV